MIILICSVTMATAHSLVIQIFVFVLLAHPGTMGTTLYCDSVLRAENFDPRIAWTMLPSCLLHDYKAVDVVECLNLMSSSHTAALEKRPLHFLFMGDSRLRQHFMAIVHMMVPSYDTKWSRVVADTSFRTPHYDMKVESHVLNLRLSYKWAPVMSDKLIEEFKTMATEKLREAPTFLLIGFGVHHMCSHYPYHPHHYERNLTRLEPSLRILAQHSHVVWWNQYQVNDMFEWGEISQKIFSEKVLHYNRLSQRILKDSGVVIWNSADWVANEYLRSCKIIRRQDVRWYHNCEDLVHTGYVPFFRAMNFFFNHLCNRLLVNSSHPLIRMEPDTCCYSMAV